jgi:outer membrane protein assembly factor BamB
MQKASSSRPAWRWMSFAVLVLLLAGVLLFLRVTKAPEVPDSVRNGFIMLTLEASIVLFAAWFFIFGWSRWWIRLGLVVAGFAVLIGGLYYGFTNVWEIRGVTGDWVPKFAWKSTPKPDYALDDDPKAETPKVPPAATAEIPDFTRFLGSDGSNHVNGAGLDTDWEKHPPKELWRRPIGAGWSAFAVSVERAVTQEQRKEFEMVTCYNLRDGALLWSHRDKTRFGDFQGGDGPRATPTIVGDRVFTMGANGLLNCLTLDKGEVVWSKNVLDDNNEENKQTGHVPVWGKSNSPLVYEMRELRPGDHSRLFVVVTLGEDQNNPKLPVTTLAAYDGASGQRIWTAGDDKCSYATPILANLLGTTQIISVNGTSVTGHDLATGKVLWVYPWPGQMAKCSQPIVVGEDKVFLSMGYFTGALLFHVEKKGEEWKAVTEPLWKNAGLMRTTFSNVVVHKGHVYGLDDGSLECIELETGVKKWRERDNLYRTGQVLGVDDVLIVQAEDGKVYLVAADPQQHRILGELDALHSKTWNNPVLVGKFLLLRNAEEAVCYEVPLKGK